MNKKQKAGQQLDRQQDRRVVDDYSSDKGLPRSGQKYLKELDRDLPRFMARVMGLETRSTYNDAVEGPNLALEAEEIYREALMLRAEIRQCLATGKASNDDVVENINDSWDQLCESFEELESASKQHRPARDPWMTTLAFETDDMNLVEELDDVGFDDDWDYNLPQETDDRRIHRPRGGPKR